MDNGEEIPGLNQDWTFLGAKPLEWLAGFAAFVLCAEVFFKGNLGPSVPILLIISVGTTTSLASLRRRFPDEERGVMNLMLVSLGFKPPNLPTPSALQKYWSGAPLRELDKEKEFMTLNLDQLFENREKKEDEE
jgi:hypothetical protein